MGVDELDPGDAQPIGEAAGEPGQAHGAAGERVGLGFDETSAGTGVGADQEDGDEEDDDGRKAADESGEDLEGAADHQNVSPRPT